MPIKWPWKRWARRRPETGLRHLRETCPQLRAIAIAFAMALALISVHAQNTNVPARNDAASATVEQLKRATQELLDAIAPGDVAVWQRYLAFRPTDGARQRRVASALRGHILQKRRVA